MNTYIFRDILLLGIGGAIGGFATNYYMKDRYEKLVQEEVDSLRETFSKYGEEVKVYDPNCVDLSDEEEFNGIVELSKTRQGRVKSEDVRYDKIDIEGGSIEDLQAGGTGDNYFPGEGDEESLDPKIPYIIDCAAFMDEKTEYEKITLSYYSDDDTLVDEREDILSNADELVGEDTLLKFGEVYMDSDPNTLYVRNRNLCSDFEIIQLAQSYQSSIMGMSDIEHHPNPIKRFIEHENERGHNGCR